MYYESIDREIKATEIYVSTSKDRNHKIKGFYSIAINILGMWYRYHILYMHVPKMYFFET